MEGVKEMINKTHDMIQQFRIDTRSPEATDTTISRLLDIIDYMNDQINILHDNQQKIANNQSCLMNGIIPD